MGSIIIVYEKVGKPFPLLSDYHLPNFALIEYIIVYSGQARVFEIYDPYHSAAIVHAWGHSHDHVCTRGRPT